MHRNWLKLPKHEMEEPMSVSQQQLDVSRDKFTAMARLLGLEAEVDVQADDERILVNIRTEDSRLMTGFSQ